MSDNVELRKLQKIQLYLLLEFRRICEKYNLRYFLTGGSLLGAVRHGGFIPWDDDIDIAMPREDYMQFLSVCQNELPNDCFLQTKNTDEKCAITIAKIRLNGTKRLDTSAQFTSSHCGIDIDIFPYDTIPDDFRARVQYNVCMMLRGINVVKSGYILLNREKSLKKSIGMVICKILSVFFTKKSVLSSIDVCSQWYNGGNSNYSMCLSGASYSYNRERMPTNIITEYTTISFEGYMFSVPKNYGEFLSILYGNDYMTPPHESQQLQHAIAELDFGKYGDEVYVEKLLAQFSHPN